MVKEKNNGNHRNELADFDNKRLQKLLQKAVKAEKASDSLRNRISKMIRKK